MKKRNYEQDFFTATKELQFANLQVAHLLSVLDELEAFGGTLEKAVIKNAKERHQIDRLIHARIIFQ